MSISYEISLTEEQFSDCTTIDSKEKDQLLNAKNTKANSSYVISSSRFEIKGEENSFYSLYLDKCKALQRLESEFNKLHQSVSSLIDNAKIVNNTHQEQIDKLKELVVFILDEFKKKKNESIEYIADFIENNNTVFKQKEEDKEIQFDDDFWENGKISNDEPICRMLKHSKSTMFKEKKKMFFMSKELEHFLYEKMKSFMLK